MPTLLFTPAARADLDGIWDFTRERWGEAQAVRYLRDLQATCTGLAEGTQPSRDAGDIRPGLRKAACGAHMVYLRQQGGDVIVIRVLHQSMDVDRHM